MEGFMSRRDDNLNMADRNDETENVTVTMPECMVEKVDERLEYGDSRSGWVREAVRQRLDRDEEIDAATDAPADD